MSLSVTEVIHRLVFQKKQCLTKRLRHHSDQYTASIYNNNTEEEGGRKKRRRNRRREEKEEEEDVGKGKRLEASTVRTWQLPSHPAAPRPRWRDYGKRDVAAFTFTVKDQVREKRLR